MNSAKKFLEQTRDELAGIGHKTIHPVCKDVRPPPSDRLVLGVSTAGLTGCVAVVAAGAVGTGVAWYSGRLEANLDHNLAAMFAASQKSLSQLEFANISNKKSAIDAQLVPRTAHDKKVEISLQKVTDRSTKVTIRAGVFGNETLSMSIMDRIKASL